MIVDNEYPDNKKLESLIYKELGYSGDSDFENTLGLRMTVYSRFNYISVVYTDMFFSNITYGSFINSIRNDIVDHIKSLNFEDEYSLPENIKSRIKSRISHMTKKKNKLEYMRTICIGEIKRFISTSFYVDINSIDDEDIRLSPLNTFWVAGVCFSYTLVISKEEVEVVSWTRKTYGQLYKDFKSIKKYFKNKEK